MFINSWPSRAVLMIALQHAAWRRIKDSPLEQSEAELLAAPDRAAPLTRDDQRPTSGIFLRPGHCVESLTFTM